MSNQPETRPYGAWSSPFNSAFVARAEVRLARTAIEGDRIFWSERRPSEGGRSVVVRCNADGTVSDCLPPPFDARSRVHEYGGGAFLAHDNALFFSNDADRRLYRSANDQTPQPLTPESPLRYADAVFDARRNRLVCIAEDHGAPGPEPANFIAGVPAEGGEPVPLLSGRDFYATPRIRPDGDAIAWLCWDHPHMPWEAAELWLGDLDPEGGIHNPRRIAGGDGESAFQPEWSPDGRLHFVSDRSGYWNLYRMETSGVRQLTDEAAEFGLPQWVFGMSTYGFLDDDTIVCACCRDGLWSLNRLEIGAGTLTACDLPFTSISDVSVGEDFAVFVGGAPSHPASIVRMDACDGATKILRRSAQSDPANAAWVSPPETIDFPTSDGDTAHGLFYPPTNPDFAAPESDRPPLLVMIHGGPTASAKTSLRYDIQYYTSRGVAVLDVNYRGSTGYGRAYREKLRGRWGETDVLDCVHGAQFLASQGRVDGARMAITGGSAGGYVALAALAFHDVFAAGASHFGVSDCEALAKETHKFESHYLDSLIGPYPAERQLYLDRSPIHHAEAIRCPVIFFQGDEDRIVPPGQAESMVRVLRERGVPVAYVLFRGEQHGFRRAEHIAAALDMEFAFLCRAFGIRPAEQLPPIEVFNEERLGRA